MATPSAPAGAQSSGAPSCGAGSGPLGTATVTIDQPAANAVVSGSAVLVRGTAQTSFALLTRVEATLAGRTQVRDYDDASSSLDYSFTFDVSNVPPGEATLSVVACGTGNLTGVLARGSATRRVIVRAPSPPTTSAAVTTTVALPAGVLAGGPTTTLPVATTAPEAAATTTTSKARPTTTEARARVERAQPARPRSGSSDPVMLTESPEDRSPRPPLWVGAVVGISGGLGLLFSAASSSRRRARLPEEAEPVDPDLVEVG